VKPEDTFIPRQQLGKQVSAATDTQVTTEELLGTMFYIWSMQSGSLHFITSLYETINIYKGPLLMQACAAGYVITYVTTPK
jgi:hypothetical protein